MKQKQGFFEWFYVDHIPGIYAEGYIIFAFPFVLLSVCMFVPSFVRACVRASRSWNLRQGFPQIRVKVSQVGYISRTSNSNLDHLYLGRSASMP